MRPPLLSILALLSLFATSSAQADAAADVQAYLARPNAQELARAAMKDAAAQALPTCQTYEADDASRVFYKPLRLEKGEPASGLFRETATVRGCGLSRRISVLALVRADGRIERMPLLPGTTLSDPVVQREAIPFAIGGAYAKVPSQCHDIRVRNTEFIGYDPVNIEGKKPWREVWTIEACKTSIAVDMLFRPDAEGTTVIARPHRS